MFLFLFGGKNVKNMIEIVCRQRTTNKQTSISALRRIFSNFSMFADFASDETGFDVVFVVFAVFFGTVFVADVFVLQKEKNTVTKKKNTNRQNQH
jgi:hypothetical protein